MIIAFLNCSSLVWTRPKPVVGAYNEKGFLNGSKEKNIGGGLECKAIVYFANPSDAGKILAGGVWSEPRNGEGGSRA